MCFCVLGLLALVLGLSVRDADPPLRWARVWGGPTEGPAPILLRIEELGAGLGAYDAGSRSGRLLVNAGSKSLPLAFDDENSTIIQLERTGSDPVVSVEVEGKILANGRLRLTREGFWQRRHRRGGWWHGRTDGALRIAAGCRDGVLVLGKPGQLGLSVTDTENKPVSTDLMVQLEGLELAGRAGPVTIRTDERGRALLPVVPMDLAASIRITAGPANATVASFFSSVPVESTAMFGRVRDNVVVVDSLIPTSSAYYSLINEQGSWAFGKLHLNCDPNGHCHGELPLSVSPPLPMWLMLGTEPRLDGPNVIGWPVAANDSDFVMESVVVPNQLLLDGQAMVFAAAAKIRAARFARVLGGMAIAGAVLLFTITVHLVNARQRLAAFERALPSDLPTAIIERRSPWLLAILLLAVLGLAAIVFWARFTFFRG